MEKDQKYADGFGGKFQGEDSSVSHDLARRNCQQFVIDPRTSKTSRNDNNQTSDYIVNNGPPPQHLYSGFPTPTSFDKLSFADVMQFAELGARPASNQIRPSEEEAGLDPVYFLKFPVLNERLQEEADLVGPLRVEEHENKGRRTEEEEEEGDHRENEARVSEITSTVQLQLLGEDRPKSPTNDMKNKRKRPRTMKTSEEVESQRMTHIAVERNRRKQMNEHLRVLRALMPGSYVQRGDQASIIGGAIEFVRELEQLLQCLESQKRRRIYGDAQRPLVDPSAAIQSAQQQLFPPIALTDDQLKLVELETGLREETAESKSCLADVEVRLLGFDAMIKILCRRQPGQLIKTIAALEDLQLNILHTNITTIEQTVLYSFNVKVSSEARFTADDIAASVQQILTAIHANM